MRRSALLLLLALPLPAEKKVIIPEGAPRSSSPLSPAIQTNDWVYGSGMTGRGDVRAQTREVLNRIGGALKAAGLDFRHVASTTLYLADIRTLATVDEVYREYFPKDPPARTTLECLLMGPDPVVEISAIAIRDLATRKVIHPEGWARPAQPVSHAVQAGDTLFLSALHGRGDTIQAQTEHVMRLQQQLLAAAGLGFADLVSTRIYLAHPSDYNGLNEAYRRFVTAAPPARATVQAFPVEPGSLLQIQSIAVRGSGNGRPGGEGHTSPIHSYSVKAGRRLFITGMTGRAPDGQFARNDIRAQTRQALKTIQEQLGKHGYTFADIVDSVVWLRDSRLFQGMNEVYREMVTPDPPARATVRLAPNAPEGLVEIMMIAEK